MRSIVTQILIILFFSQKYVCKKREKSKKSKNQNNQKYFNTKTYITLARINLFLQNRKKYKS